MIACRASAIISRENTALIRLNSRAPREVTDPNVPTVQATMKLSEISDHIAQGDADLSRRQGTLIVDEQNQLVGIITRGDIVPK